MFFRRKINSTLVRYCLREIAVPAILAMAIIGFVGVGNELRERRAVVKLEFIGAWDVARLIVYFSPTLVAYLIPIAYMMGILLAFGRLAQHNEITAMKAGGVPLKAMVAPVVAIGALLSVGTFFLQDRVQPVAMAQANRLLFEELPQRVSLDVLPVGVMNDFGGYRVYFKSRDVKNKLLRDITVVQPQAGRDYIFYSESAQFVDTPEGKQLVLGKGQLTMPRGDGSVMPLMFDSRVLPLDSPMLRPPPALHKSLSIRELLAREKESADRYAASTNKKRSGEDLRTLRSEIGDRITIPLTCLAVSLAAAPLAVRAPRSGRSYSFAIGFLLIFGYYVLRLLLESKSVDPLSEFIVRGIVPSGVLAVIGLWALWRVDRV